MRASAGDQAQTVVVRPSSGWPTVGLRELWSYRELLYFFVWRDIKVRYKQTVLGAAWAILQPLLTMAVFTLFFGHLAGIDSGDAPYALFALAALVPWTFFATAVLQASNSLVEQERVLDKVYFPRLLVPTAAVLACLVDLGISFVFLLLLLLAYGSPVSVAILTLPLFVLLAVLAAVATSLWLSALNVLFRDVRYTLPFLVQLWLFISPVAYASSLVPETWRLVYGVNPMVGVIDGFRWALLDGPAPALTALAVSVGVVVILLAGGLLYFRRMEQTFADAI